MSAVDMGAVDMSYVQYYFYRVTNIVGAILLFFAVMLPQSVASAPTMLCEGSDIACAKTVTATVSPTGRIWFTWTVNDYLYVNHSDDRGKTFSAAIKVNEIPEKIAARGEKRPKIAVDNTGNVYVSWVKKLSEKWTSNIRFSWLRVDEKLFSSPITVNDDIDITGHSFNEMIVSDNSEVTSTAEVTIVWLDGRNAKAAKKKGEPYVGSSIYWAVIKPSPLKENATLETAEIQNSAYVNGNCVCCRLAFTPMQTSASKIEPVVMWRHIFGDNIRDHALGVLGEPLKRVSFEQWKVEGCPHHGPSISAQNKRLHMSWFNDAPNASGLFYAYTDNLGETVSPVFHFSKRADSPSHPSLITGGDGKLRLAWQTFDGIQSSIQIISSNRGEKWSDAQVVAQFSGQTDYPFLLPHSDGDLLLWHKPGHALVLKEVL